MNLIEKLGITHGPWEASEHGDYRDFNGDSKVVFGNDMRIAAVHDCGIDENNAALIAAAPEMLEALITFRDDISAEAEEESGIYIDDIIEKATGKTWVEIKELIK